MPHAAAIKIESRILKKSGKTEKLSLSEDFKAVFYRYQKPIAQYIYLRVGSFDKTKDLVQDVFVRLWQARDRVRPDTLNAYIYKIANNLVIDHLRRRKTENTYMERPETGRDYSTTDNIEKNLALKLAIQNLPPKLQTVFLLGRYQGLSYSEIADVCQISYKTVVVRMSKAMMRLKELLT
ncbi:sigma-70 family RNA polymerase sigma factor [candidate division KSB1 bacterium]|nr:sigma-70 family RNA polymerase sigma factor [candidate division KSB1 bacterium]